jgi:signal transduction histidine kinase
MLAAYGAYRIRMRQIIQRVSLRMQERIEERSRIARELHDSLLQGAQGLIFRLQAIREMLPAHAREAAIELDRALDRGDQTLAEARGAVTGIRVKVPAGDDIVSALRALSTESSESGSARPSPSFRFLVEGRNRPLRELIRDDIYQIAREAFRNAVKHAHGKNIEVELRYSKSYFVLRVRDDGCGMNASTVLKKMHDGHWGIQGMRERAALMGGQLQIWTEDKAGTEIQLRLPAAVAYADVRGRTQKSTSRDDAKM